jgi:hypothetical protein
LGDLADRLGGLLEVVERDPAGDLLRRPLAHPDPGLGDHTEDPL